MAKRKKTDTAHLAKSMQIRLYTVLVVIALLFMALGYRLFYLAYHKSQDLAQIQNSQILFERKVNPPRGDILDRHGKPLAKDTPLVRIIVDPRSFHRDWCIFNETKCPDDIEGKKQTLEREQKRLEDVADALSMSFKKLESVIRSEAKRSFKVIAKEVPPTVLDAYPALKGNKPYVFAEYYFRRFYPLKEEASSLVGFVNYQGKGMSGVEKAFENQLRSQPGMVLEKYSGKVGLRKNKDGIRQRQVFSSEVIHQELVGQPMRLSIDNYLQHISYQALLEDALEFGAESANVVMVDVPTGEILALADFPGTNPNDRSSIKFEHTVSAAFSQTHEPGSSIKPLVMAGLHDLGLLSGNEIINTSPGHIFIDKWLVRDVKNYGKLRPDQILEKSSNVGMIKLADRIQGDQFSHFLNSLGLNEPSGAFPGLESIGNLGNAWESDVTKLNQSYGYGFDVSLLGLARAYLALARDGEMIPLTVVAGQSDSNKAQVISKNTANQVFKWMTRVTSPTGTGHRAALDGIKVAGKTGTARARGFKMDTNEVYNNNFVGIYPAKDPQVLILVAYRNTYPPYHYGGATAAKTFKKIAQKSQIYMDSNRL